MEMTDRLNATLAGRYRIERHLGKSRVVHSRAQNARRKCANVPECAEN